MELFFISSGLVLGWSLGANDAANIFGSAYGAKMISFGKAALLASVFFVLGAVLQGKEASKSLQAVAHIRSLTGAFVVALATAATIFSLNRRKLPVSTSQAIVGALIGWNLFMGVTTDSKALVNIVYAWFLGPSFSCVLAILLYLSIKKFISKSKLHLLKIDAMLRWGLVFMIVFGAYSLGANNIANVMGVFAESVHWPTYSLGRLQLSCSMQLFFLGGLATSLGIFTYSKRVLTTMGKGLLHITPEAAFIISLSQAITLFVFSSASLQWFLSHYLHIYLPLAPVSSTQLIVGAIFGIALINKLRGFQFVLLAQIGLGWIVSPLVSGGLCYILLNIAKNVFKMAL